MREMLATVLQVSLALTSVREQRSDTSAGWAAILAVPTVVFSLYGMNFDKMPDCTGTTAIRRSSWRRSGVRVLYLRLKRTGWLCEAGLPAADRPTGA